MHCRVLDGLGKTYLTVGIFFKIDEVLSRVLIKNQCDI